MLWQDCLGAVEKNTYRGSDDPYLAIGSSTISLSRGSGLGRVWVSCSLFCSHLCSLDPLSKMLRHKGTNLELTEDRVGVL